ncbi:SIAT2 sialyltransferase, partial [Amia calva]|nr:SIAT2 sialyltransferase [Amia calva]
MKSNIKQWKQMVLIGMLAWVLLFLALFTYFMDYRVDDPNATGSMSYTETRRLTSIQGNNRVIMVSQQEAAASNPNSHSDLFNYHYVSEQAAVNLQSKPIQTRYSLETNGKNTRSRDRRTTRSSSGGIWFAAGQQQMSRDDRHTMEKLYPDEDDPEEIKQEPITRRKSRLGNSSRRREKLLDTVDDLEEYYFLKSKSVIYKLWKGNVSSKMLTPRLQKAMKDYLNANKHHVNYKGKRRTRLSGEEVLCELKSQIRVRSLDGTEAPFSSLGWDKLVPKVSINELYPLGFRSCAVVTSAGAILNSSLGKEIDSHQAVLRFNTAPTEGYEMDVGNKTTIRIINSQILANPNHRFNISTLYKDVTLVAWDPAPYTVNLHKWYKNPDYNLFTPYVEYRKKYPHQPFYILHPKFIWQLWDVIQGNTHENIQPNPPSSGFIGILIMMSLCDEVHVYEYIPSIRQTDLCHYHERYFDAACTLGAYHPLLYEKMLIQRMNTGTDKDLKKKGKVTLPGFSAITCKT